MEETILTEAEWQNFQIHVSFCGKANKKLKKHMKDFLESRDNG